MNLHLVTGGCGFVGRNVVKRLLATTPDMLVVVDDLSTGLTPTQWLPEPLPARLCFIPQDVRSFLRALSNRPNLLVEDYQLPTNHFTDVFHFAAIVGGRAKIEGDPMAVALDLAIDAELFYWVCQHRPERLLYPSSSAAYPVDLQTEAAPVPLKEADIVFEGGRLGQPDMTYGWSKLTGEYLARIAAQHYGVSVACVRPFSGYGEDQDLSYPIPALAARAARQEDPFEVWGTGHQGRDFVHIDDCVDAILLAMERIKDGSALNIGSGRLTSFRDIIAHFAAFAGYKPTLKPLLDKPVGVHARFSDPSLALQRYGWYPRISLAEGLRRVYDATVQRL